MMKSRQIPVVVAAGLLAMAVATAPQVGLAESDARGAELFVFCSQCHGEQGGGNQLYLAPAIAGLSEWYVLSTLQKFRAGGRGNHPDDVAGLRMRPMSLWLSQAADVEAVAAYVGSLPPVNPPSVVEGGDAARGELLFKTCSACHGPDASGNQQLFAPPLRHNSDWYLLTQLKKFKAGIRGANPKDQAGALMRPMAMTLVDEQAMRDVIAHIKTLAR